MLVSHFLPKTAAKGSDPLHCCAKEKTSVFPKATIALVIGVSVYQDSQLTALPDNVQNAELFAAFLRSREGGLLPSDQLQLLTGEDATQASFSTAIGWLEEESKMGDYITVYFGGNARLVNSEIGPVPYLFFADSPLFLGNMGGMPLAKLCYMIQELAKRKGLGYNLIFDLNMGATTSDEDDIWRQWLEALQNTFPYAYMQETLDKPQEPLQASSGFMPILLEGLLGQADINGNEQILPKEAAKYLRNEHKKVPGGSIILMAFSDEKNLLAEIDKSQDRRGWGKKYNNFPTLVGQDMSRLEDSLLAKTDAHTRQWYQDYILTNKLGKLMEPSGRCMSDLYDSLLTNPDIQPLHSHLRRQLAASLQDETQQALNDYLRTDTRELQRRWKHGGNYAIYPKYMKRVVELLGEKHFMYSIIQCKKFYFEGLTARLDFEKTKDSTLLLHEALEKQIFALNYEPEAAFVLNELGILHFYLGSDSAKSFYVRALRLAPQWGVPYLNISLLYTDNNNEQLDSALFYAHTAVNLTPWNPVAVQNIGTIYFKLENYTEAEIWLKRAASMDPTNNTIYYDLSCTKAMQGELGAAIQWLEFAFKYGYTDINHLKADKDLFSIQESPQLNQLLRKYFPGKIKD